MKFRIMASGLALSFLAALTIATTTSEAYIPSETTNTSLEYVQTDNLEQISNLMNVCQEMKELASNMAEAGRGLGYNENHKVILLAKEEWTKADKLYNKYQADYNKIKSVQDDKWKQKEKEYPEATYVWKYLKSLNYNDYVCAGIMGNLMAEVGGQTLKLNPYARSKGYYGMCQWSKGYSEVWGAGLAGQCNFLAKSIRYELNTYGKAYQKGFNYNKFIALTNEKQAALAFAKCYERCGSASYKTRQLNATKALNYFTK